MIDSVATAVECSYGLECSIMQDRLKFRKVCARRLLRELQDPEKFNRIFMSALATSLTACRLRRRYA
jgi:hypothetical protein